MESPEPLPRHLSHKIVAVDQLSDAIVVAFDDGKEFVYPAEVLRSLISQEFEVAQQVRELLDPNRD